MNPFATLVYILKGFFKSNGYPSVYLAGEAGKPGNDQESDDLDQ